MYPEGYCKCLQSRCWYCSQMFRIIRGLVKTASDLETERQIQDEREWIVYQHGKL